MSPNSAQNQLEFGGVAYSAPEVHELVVQRLYPPLYSFTLFICRFLARKTQTSTVAEIYKAFWAFWELRARTAADLKTSRTFSG